MMIFRFLALLLLCSGCKKGPEKEPPFTWQEFKGRDEVIAYNQMVRRPVYQAKVPLVWKKIEPSESESIRDTTKSIVAFTLDERVAVTVHTFPTDSLDERIPPAAQVERWRTQLKQDACRIEKVGHDGFAGFYFEGKHENTSVIAWSLQLDLDHYQSLHFIASTVEEEEHYRQMAADYTIKVIGPTPLVEKHREEINLFANSFALIQEIPARM